MAKNAKDTSPKLLKKIRTLMENPDKDGHYMTFKEAEKKHGVTYRSLAAMAKKHGWDLPQYPRIQRDKNNPKKHVTKTSIIHDEVFKTGVLEAIAKNLTPVQAYRLMGVSAQSLTNHRRWARQALEVGDKDNFHVKWMDQIRQAQEERAKKLVSLIEDAALTGLEGGETEETVFVYDYELQKLVPTKKVKKTMKQGKSWQAAAWLLERTRKDVYSKQEIQEHVGENVSVNPQQLADIFTEQIQKVQFIDKDGNPVEPDEDEE